MTFDFRASFNNFNVLDRNKVISLQYKKYKNQLNLPNHVNDNYFQTLSNFIVKNNHLQQNSKLQKG